MITAVIAGTPVDTLMGIDFLRRKDPVIETLYLPCAESPRECHLFQLKGNDEKKAYIEQLYRKALEKGADRVFVYCNSLSSSVDFDCLSDLFHIITVTPMKAYEEIARMYDTVGVLAANNQCTKGIEDRFTSVNPGGTVIGVGNLRLTEAVEQKIAPSKIVKEFDLFDLCRYFKVNGCEAVVLGCTHFPWFQNEITALTDLPVIDPAEIMYNCLVCS